MLIRGGIDHLDSPAAAHQPKAFDKKSRAMTSSPIFARSSWTSVSREASCRSWFPEKAGQHRLSSRLLPVGHQVRMHIVAGRQLRHRRFLAKRLQRDLRLQLSRITPSLPWHSRLLLLGLDPTLASCPNSGVHLFNLTIPSDALLEPALQASRSPGIIDDMESPGAAPTRSLDFAAHCRSQFPCWRTSAGTVSK